MDKWGMAIPAWSVIRKESFDWATAGLAVVSHIRKHIKVIVVLGDVFSGVLIILGFSIMALVFMVNNTPNVANINETTMSILFFFDYRLTKINH